MDHFERRAALSRAHEVTAVHIARSQTSCRLSEDHVRKSKLQIGRSLELLRSTAGTS